MYQITTDIARRKPPMVREGQSIPIRDPETVKNEMQDIAHLAQEVFAVITLNSKNRMIDKAIITKGIINASLVHPREVYAKAIKDTASAIILVHNHPSGDVMPSTEDIRITRNFVEAGEIMGIPMQDHIIIGYDDAADEIKYISLREGGLVDFKS